MNKRISLIITLALLTTAAYAGYKFTGSDGSVAKSIYVFNSQRPMYIAHRNQALVYPDHSRAAVKASAKSSLVDALEIDVRKLSDGALVNFHDTKLSRLTGLDGRVEELTLEEFMALRINPKKWDRPRISEDDTPTTYLDILSEYKGVKIIIPEVKTKGAGEAVANALAQQGVPKDEAIVQSFVLEDLNRAIVLGYPAMFLTKSTDSIDCAKSRGVTWAGIQQDAPDDVFKSWVAAGFKVVAWTVNDINRRDELLSMGVIGFFTDDVKYLSTGIRGY